MSWIPEAMCTAAITTDGPRHYRNEWCAFEGIAIAAGILGEVELASQSVVMTTASMVYMLPFGVSVATTVRVGNWLGANRPWSGTAPGQRTGGEIMVTG